VVDLQVLIELVDDNHEVIPGLLGDFIQSVTEIMVEVEAAYDTKIASEVGLAAHKLKSSSLAVGANGLTKVCRSVEASGKNGDWAAVENQLPLLRSTVAAVVASIDEYRRKR